MKEHLLVIGVATGDPVFDTAHVGCGRIYVAESRELYPIEIYIGTSMTAANPPASNKGGSQCHSLSFLDLTRERSAGLFRFHGDG